MTQRSSPTQMARALSLVPSTDAFQGSASLGSESENKNSRDQTQEPNTYVMQVSQWLLSGCTIPHIPLFYIKKIIVFLCKNYEYLKCKYYVIFCDFFGKTKSLVR